MPNEWATMDTVLPEKDLHVKGTMRKPGGRYSFMMYNPEIPQDRDNCRVRCGMCKRPMDGCRSCPNCYPWRQDS